MPANRRDHHDPDNLFNPYTAYRDQPVGKYIFSLLGRGQPGRARSCTNSPMSDSVGVCCLQLGGDLVRHDSHARQA